MTSKNDSGQQSMDNALVQTIYAERISQLALGPHVVKLLLTQDSGPKTGEQYTHSIVVPSVNFLEFISNTLEILKKEDMVLANIDEYRSQTVAGLREILNKLDRT